MKHFLLLLTFTSLFTLKPLAATLHIGSGQTYATFEAAAADAQPGDTILFHAGTHTGEQYVADLQGTANAWIFIHNAPGEVAIIEGGGNALQLSDPAYLHISGLIFQHQTGNGVNTDDGGSYDTPAHHVVFENCTFRDMSATGNNDLLKLSGLDTFEVRSCTFLNGAEGGSGIDMVGCHHGVFEENFFENMGSNCIQAKGGSEHLRIERNFFLNGGQRSLNLGGSTDLQFFRPDTAHFEAAHIQVYSNIFIGSWAPIAYVGSVNVEVVNNTFYQPENWVIRILQETVDPDRFIECGDNSFRNNIVYLGNNLSTETNIGPNTRPETFTFSNNLWYNYDDTNWGGPAIPVADVNGIINQDPLFANAAATDFHIPMNSPAAGAGFPLGEPDLDYYGQGFANPPSIGAVEANPVSVIFSPASPVANFELFPNPGGQQLRVRYEQLQTTEIRMEIYAPNGELVSVLEYAALPAGAYERTFELKNVAGWYLVKLSAGGRTISRKWLQVR